MRIDELATTEDLEMLRPEWGDLCARCPQSTPFQSPAWLIPWWRHIGEGRLRSIAVRIDGRLAGLAPFYIYTQDDGSRDVFLLGIGTSDYLDIIVDPEHQDGVLDAVFAYLNDIGDEWDVCDFQQLRPDSPLVSASTPVGWTHEMMWHEVCPVLWLDGPNDGSAPAKIPPKMLENVRYAQRKLAKVGKLTYESAREDNLYELFYALLDLHAARWSSKGESGVLWVASVQMAHREALPKLLDSGVLRLYALRLDGRIIAVLYGLADGDCGGRFYYYLSGFDPEFEQYSPGALIVAHAVFQAQQAGACAFDFLRGKEDYKYRWGAVDTFTYRRRLRHPKR